MSDMFRFSRAELMKELQFIMKGDDPILTEELYSIHNSINTLKKSIEERKKEILDNENSKYEPLKKSLKESLNKSIKKEEQKKLNLRILSIMSIVSLFIFIFFAESAVRFINLNIIDYIDGMSYLHVENKVYQSIFTVLLLIVLCINVLISKSVRKIPLKLEQVRNKYSSDLLNLNKDDFYILIRDDKFINYQQEKINELESKVSNLRNEINKRRYRYNLPYQCRGHEGLLYQYLECNRAENLNEAIELLEIKEHRDRMESYAREQVYKQEQIQEQIYNQNKEIAIQNKEIAIQNKEIKKAKYAAEEARYAAEEAKYAAEEARYAK